MLDFPNSPTVGQQYTAAGVTWTWDGVKYVPASVSVVQAMNDNRIINGDMRIDQRNNGASGTANAAVYTVDRWIYAGAQPAKGTWGRNLGGPSLPSGFPYCLGFVSSSAYASIAADYFQFVQNIEADMVSDFAWGTANAQPVTLSFWVVGSIVGTYSASIGNAAGTRSYPFSFPVTAGWTKVTVTIPGDTAGTWVMSGNAASVGVHFDLGSGSNYRGSANAWASASLNGVTGTVSVVGTNGAYFYVTGVKLETGSIATPFNRQSLAKSLEDCQRYYQTAQIYLQPGAPATAIGQAITGSTMLPVSPRAAPTLTLTGNASGNISTPTLGQIASGAGVNASATASAAAAMTLNVAFSASAEI